MTDKIRQRLRAIANRANPGWQQLVAEGDAELAAGQSKTYDSIEEFFDALEIEKADDK